MGKSTKGRRNYSTGHKKKAMPMLVRAVAWPDVAQSRWLRIATWATWPFGPLTTWRASFSATTATVTTAAASALTATSALTTPAHPSLYGSFDLSLRDGTVLVRISTLNHLSHAFSDFVFGDLAVLVLVECHNPLDLCSHIRCLAATITGALRTTTATAFATGTSFGTRPGSAFSFAHSSGF